MKLNAVLHFKLIAFTAIVLSAVCLSRASSPTVKDVIQTGPDTYVISAASAFNGTSKKDAIIRIANEFAESKRKQAVEISLKETHPVVGFGGQFEYQFKLVDKPIAAPSGPTANTSKGRAIEAVDRLYEALTKLAELRDKGLLSPEEFAVQKQRLLDSTKP